MSRRRIPHRVWMDRLHGLEDDDEQLGLEEHTSRRAPPTD
jgi:hypothetical protein